ncbi:MAG: sensor histidine kinase [Vallitaleaceae bacterium]|nr:sensor histidine kinase [Vallitaleaceae bacterium]
MKNSTIQIKFMLAILLVAILPLFVTPILGYVYTSSILRDKLVTLTNQNLEAVSEGVNQIIDDIIIASNVVVLDKDIVNVLKNTSIGTEIGLSQRQFVLEKLQNMEASNLYPYNAETLMVDLKGNAYYTSPEEYINTGDFLNESWYQEAISRNGYFIWIGTDIPSMKYKGGITMARLVKEDYYTPIAVLFMHIYPEKKVKSLLTREKDFLGTQRYLIDEQSNVIMNSSADTSSDLQIASIVSTLGHKEFMITKVKGQKVVISLQSIKKPNWSVLQITPYESIMKDVRGYRNIMIMTNLIFLIVMLIVAFFVAKFVTKAISRLSFFMGKVTEGNFNVKSNISGSYEVNQLSNSFNKMVDRIEELVTQVAYETEQKQQTKLEALQAQINPHFLLNTLNGIKWLCVIENAKTAEKMLISLGYLLENTLGKYDELITIEEEIKCLESYTQLQIMRYGKKFEVHFDIPDGLRQMKVPVLLLQPIVENSIIHAFNDTEEMGIIKISAYETLDYVKIVIEDNGSGIQQDQITQLLSQYPPKNKYSSMGMRNVKERIQLYYGDGCDMVIESDIGMGTRTLLTILKEVKTRG